MSEPCIAPHTTKVNGIWQQGQENQIEVVTSSNGVIVVKLRCTCGQLSGALPRDVVWEWLDPFGPVVFRSNEGAETCVIEGCTSIFIEWHHFAPRNTFREQADDWPVLPLCRPHHVEWHSRMDGYQWHRVGGAA